MPDLLEFSFHPKNHFISIHFHFIDSDSMLQVFPEGLQFMCKSAIVWGIDCAQSNCNPSWNPVNGDKYWTKARWIWRWLSITLHHSCNFTRPSIMNFHAGIERESIQASSYHHSIVPQIHDKQ